MARGEANESAMASGATDNSYSIRPYRRGDRQTVRDICVATCWMGEYRPDVIPDDWLWAEYWTRYFTDRQSRFAWVVVGPDGRVAGYLTGTPDADRFEAYAPYLLGGIFARIVRKRLISNRRSRRALLALVRSSLRGEMALPAAVRRECPATWHFNLLPAARRRGLGSAMLGMFLGRLRQVGCRGLHGQMIGSNAAAVAVYRRIGMRMVCSSPLTAFAHAIPEPLQLHTYAMSL